MNILVVKVKNIIGVFMVLKRIFLIFLFVSFISVSNLFSYTLPKEAEMLSFLPDRLGNWIVDNTLDTSRLVDNPFLNPAYNKSRSAYRLYINGNKRIAINISASVVKPVEPLEQEDENDIVCDYSTKDIEMQGFNGFTMQTKCNDGSKIHSLTLKLIDEKDFVYNIGVAASSFGNDGISARLPNGDDLYNVTNMLDLKGISSLIE